MNDFLGALLFWGVLPAVMLGRRGHSRWARVFLFGLPCIAPFLFHDIFSRMFVALELLLVVGAAGAALYLTRRSAYKESRRVGDRLRRLRVEVRRSSSRVGGLSEESLSRQAAVERLQNRFALVQGMATRLDAEVLLQSLGNLWADVAGVRRVVLLHRKTNGNWGVAFSRGFPSTDQVIPSLESYPTLMQGKRLRKVPSLERFPRLRDGGLEPPFFLVPVVWGEDVMALGYVEASDELFDEGEAGLNTERKLVSIGLRRAHLFDLMTERSRHDGLTGAFLRRTFMERLGESVRKSLRYRTPLFAAIFDIDHFKSINDTYGHPAGDQALVRTAQIVRDLAEPGITLGRVGGDEFALILELPTLTAATAWMEKLRAAVQAGTFVDGGREIRLTISAGVCAFRPEDPSPDATLARADEALYRSKSGGRNLVSVHPSSLSTGGS